jgi:adenine nucleotide transporter 17
VNPVSVIQTRMMTQAKKNPSGGAQLGFFALALSIFRNEGIGAFFNGILPAFILSSNPSIQFLVFDRLRLLVLRVLSQSGVGPRSLSVVESFILGAISKIVATLVTYPYILAKMRLQYKGDQSGAAGAAAAVVYKGTIDVLLRTLKYEGIRGLFTGLQAQLLKSVLGAALMFMAKEKISDISAWVAGKVRTIQNTASSSKPPQSTADLLSAEQAREADERARIQAGLAPQNQQTR